MQREEEQGRVGTGLFFSPQIFTFPLFHFERKRRSGGLRELKGRVDFLRVYVFSFQAVFLKQIDVYFGCKRKGKKKYLRFISRLEALQPF